jgi:hypothetical protein
VPQPDSCTAANSTTIRSPRQRALAGLAPFEDASVSAAALTFRTFHSLKSSFLQAGTASFPAMDRIADERPSKCACAEYNRIAATAWRLGANRVKK